jgi:Tfp pilus assembly protein PilE
MLVATLIVIGVLAVVGLQQSAVMRESAHVTVMVDDLRKLAESEEAFYADHSTYYGGTVPSGLLAFMPSAGVIIRIDAASANGWAATAVTTGSSRHCVAVFGKPGRDDSDRAETQATCIR